jgi:hypothetical protein
VTAYSVVPPAPLTPKGTLRRAERGASFFELMLAVLIISTTVVASHASLTGTVSAYHYFADGAHESLLLAKEIHEAALLLPWEEGEESTVEFGDVETLYDLDRMTFTPPRSAGYDIVTSHIGWSQAVTVRTVDMADPTQEVDPFDFEGPTLTELTVSVNDGTKVVGTYSWWLTEPTGG